MAILLVIFVIGALILYERHVRLGGAKNSNSEKPTKNMYIHSPSDPIKKPKNWTRFILYTAASLIGLFIILVVVLDRPRPPDTSHYTGTSPVKMMEKGSSTETTPPIERTDSVSAYTMAEMFVERNLKAPTTAKFPWPRDEFTKEVATNKWVVRAYVDAQNGFGAMIRSYFEVKMTYLGNEKWQLDGIKFSE